MDVGFGRYQKPFRAAWGLLAVAGSGIFALDAAAAPDPTCVNYYTIGDSDCSKLTAPKPQPVSIEQTARNMAPIEVKSEVDKYLENYGKPPREFVEFYLNPTAENATKWVDTYQGMLQKGQDISRAWSDAEQLYGGAAASGGAAVAPALLEPARQGLPSGILAAPQAAGMPSVPAPSERFGAFANAAPAQSPTTNGIRSKGVSLTYYFSQTCPYCVRMTPELAELAKETSSKLAFTCVDVTPVGATSRPEEAYITAKLPCQWRLPQPGEVEREQVSQTPTLVIQKEGELPVRLSGYVPLAQLRSYF